MQTQLYLTDQLAEVVEADAGQDMALLIVNTVHKIVTLSTKSSEQRMLEECECPHFFQLPVRNFGAAPNTILTKSS